MHYYLENTCDVCNNPLRILFDEINLEWNIECVSCLKIHKTLDDFFLLQSMGYKVSNQFHGSLPKQKVKHTHPTQIIEINSTKKISISRTGKFYFVQQIINDKKTPLRPFNSISEALEAYPELNDKKINI